MVTHSTIDASYAKRVLFIKDGRLYHEIYRGKNRNKISKSVSLIVWLF